VSIYYHRQHHEQSAFEGFDAVIHLAGENAAGRWNEEKKKKLVQSRVDTTRTLVDIFSRLTAPPRIFLCASAIGIHGDTGQREVDENTGPGCGFLAELAINWEAQANRAKDLGIRVVNLRFGLVLSVKGGSLAKMLLPFNLGLGGHLGDGKQIWSWISMDDVIASIRFILRHENLEGPFNLVAPNPVSNQAFTRALARALRRPAFCHLPEFLVKLIMGEMGEELLLSSVAAKPTRLLENGYDFIDVDLESTLIKLTG